MPTYEYRCPQGHILERFARMDDDHPATIWCDNHHTEATRILSAGLPPAGVSYVRAQPGWSDEERAAKHAPPPFAIFVYVCKDHGPFSEINDFTEGEDPAAPRPCPKCGVDSDHGLTVPHVDGTLSMYPYFNRGLGCVVESAQHLRAICKERGLTPVDGDFDASRMFSEYMRPYREAQAYVKDMNEKLGIK